MKRISPLILLIFSFFSYGQKEINIQDIYLQEIITITEDGDIVNNDTRDSTSREIAINKITAENPNQSSFLKTTMILNMLKYKLGDEIYNNSIDTYLLELNTKNEKASLKSFQTSLETTTNEDLSGFFNDWFVGSGFPSYEVSWFQNKKTKAISITATQEQSNTSVSFFEMPLPIKVSNKNGESQIIRLELSENKQSFKGKVSFDIDSVVVDPEFQLISKDNTVKNGVDQEILNTTISLYPNPATNHINIQNNSDAIVEKVSFFDMLGKLVFEEDNPLLAINLKPLSFGIHLVKIETDQGTLHKTILKEK